MGRVRKRDRRRHAGPVHLDDGDLYAFVFGWPEGRTATVDTGPSSPDTVELLTGSGSVESGWTEAARGVVISVGEDPPADHPGHAYAFRLRGVEHPGDDE